ncbi:MAG: NUDIX hydrolase [Pseudomonadota bacterium]
MSQNHTANAALDRPRVGVGVVVWHRDRVLLVQRSKAPGEGQWSLPGGSQELGETLFEAAEREVREETGLRVRSTAVLTAVDNIVRDRDGTIAFHYTIVDVLADYVGGRLVPGDDARDVCWATLDEVSTLVAWASTRDVIERSLQDPQAMLALPRSGEAETL